MKRMNHLAVALALVAMTVGCSGGMKENEAAADEMIDLLDDFASALESAKDEASAKAAAEKFNDLIARANVLKEKVAKLPKLTKAEDEALTKKMEEKAKPIQARVEAEAARIQTNPQLAVILAPKLQEFGMVMMTLKPS